MDAARGEFDHALAFERVSCFIEHHQFAGTGLRPVRSKRQDKVLIFTSWHGNREMVVDAFVKAIVNRKSQGSSQMKFGLFDVIDIRGGGQRVNGHDLAF